MPVFRIVGQSRRSQGVESRHSSAWNGGLLERSER